MERPVHMARPIRVLFRTGNFDGKWQCDVPCEYTTSEPSNGNDVDLVIGEGGPPQVPSFLKRANPHLLTGARSMESAVNYPALKSLSTQVDCPMTTNLATSAVPVVYLTRSSIAKWGQAPVAWNASALAAAFGRGAPSSSAAADRGGVGSHGVDGDDGEGTSSKPARRSLASAVFVARNCHSRNEREATVRTLDRLLRGGVDRPGMCLNSRSWPKCGKSKCGKHAVLRKYPFYLALENSDEADYVSEKVFHALEAGVLPVYNGAPNVASFLPPKSAVDLKSFGGDVAKLVSHLHHLLDHPDEYLEYFKWKERPLPAAFHERFGFVGTHAKCRLCRYAYAKKYGLPWSKEKQRPLPTSGAWL